MDLMKELKKIYEQDGITGLLPQKLPKDMLKALLVVSDDIYYNRIGPAGSPDFDAFTELMSFLWHATRPFKKSTAQDIIALSLVLRIEDFRRRGIAKLYEEFTIENLFVSKHRHRINNEKLREYKNQARKDILKKLLDDQQN